MDVVTASVVVEAVELDVGIAVDVVTSLVV